MKKIVFFLAFAGITLIITSCEQEPLLTNPLSEKIGFQVYEESEIEGQTTINNHDISFKAAKDGDWHTLQVKIDGLPLDARINYDSLKVSHDGHDAVLTSSQKLALSEWSNTYLNNLNLRAEDNNGDFVYSNLDHALLFNIAYWSEAPPNFIYSKVSVSRTIEEESMDRNLHDIFCDIAIDGVFIDCVKRGEVYTVRYDRGIFGVGTVITENIEVDRSSCNGLCGGGCFFEGTVFETWSYDCLTHDRCNDNNSEWHCWDEFILAMDDFVIGTATQCCKGD